MEDDYDFSPYDEELKKSTENANNEFKELGEELYSFRKLLRDLNQTGIALPTIFRQIAGLSGEIEAWEQAIKGATSVFKRLIASVADPGSTKDKIKQAFSKIQNKREDVLADEALNKAKKENPSVQLDEERFKDIYKKARAAYKGAVGSKKDKQEYTDLFVQKETEKWKREEQKKAGKQVYEETRSRLFDKYVKKGMSKEKAEVAAKAAARGAGKAASAAAGKAATATASAAGKMAGKSAIKMGGKALAYNIPAIGQIVAALDLADLGWKALALGGKMASALVSDVWGRFWAKREAEQKKWIDQMQQENKLVAMGIQHASALRIQQAKIEDDLSKKRIDSAQKYVDLMISGTAAAIALQEKLVAIEETRARAQKESDLARTKMTQAKDRGQSGLDFASSMEQKRDKMEKRTGFVANVAAFFRGARMIKDETGEDVDSSIVDVVDKAGISSKAEAQAMESLMAVAAAARKNAQEAMAADFNEIASSYEGLIDVVAASRVGPLSEEAQKKQEELEKAYTDLLDDMGKNSTKIKAGKIYMGSFEDAKKSGAAVYDETTDSWVYQNEKGQNIAVKNEEEFNKRKEEALGTAEGREAVQLAEAVKQKKEQLDKEAELQKEKIKYEQTALRMAQEAAKAQAEILKGLQDTIQKNIESDTENMFGMGKRKTGAEFAEEMENRADEMAREQQALNYKGDPKAEEEFRRNYNVEMAHRKDMRRIESAEKKEALDLEMRIQKEEHELKLRNEQELHSVQLQNAFNLFQAEQNYIKAQQDAFLKMLDERVSVAEIGDSIWEKSYGQGMRAFGEQIIRGQAEQEKIDIESSIDMEKAEKQADYDENTQKIKAGLLEENQKKVHELETQQLHEKYELERQLAIKEHELRIRLIAAEAKHKQAIEEASKADDKANLDAINALYRDNKKAINEMAQKSFGRNFNELSDAEKQQLAQQGITQAQGATLKSLDWLKKYAGKTEADYRKEDGTLDAKKIKEDVLAATEEHKTDILTGKRAKVEGPEALLLKTWGGAFTSALSTGDAIRKRMFEDLRLQKDALDPIGAIYRKVFSDKELSEIAEKGMDNVTGELRGKVDGFVASLTEANIDSVELHKHPELVELAALGDMYEKDDKEGDGLSDEFMDMWQKNGARTQQALTDAANNLKEETEDLEQEVEKISREAAQAAVDRENQLASLKAENEKINRELENNRKIGRELINYDLDREKRDQTSAVDREARLKVLDYNRVSSEVEKRASIAVDSFKSIAQAQTGAQYSQALMERDLKLQQHEEASGMRKRHADELREAQERGASKREEGMIIMKHDREKAELEAKQTMESIELQRRIGAETGTTMAADALWEQIQASAFAHVEDPTVTAIESLHATLDANMAQQYDALTAITQADSEQVNKYEESLQHTRYIPNIAQSVEDISKRRVGSPQRTLDPMGLRDGF